MTFGSRMKERRLALNLPRSTLAYRLGVIGNTVYRWEKGERSPDHEMTSKIARELETSISYLMGETDDPRPTKSTTKSAENGGICCDENCYRKKNENFYAGGADLTLPSGRTIRCDEKRMREYRLWEKDRSLEGTLAIAAVLGIPLIDLVPSTPSEEYPSEAHRRLTALFKTVRAVDSENRCEMGGDVPIKKSFSEYDAEYILATVFDAVKWSIKRIIDRRRDE